MTRPRKEWLLIGALAFLAVRCGAQIIVELQPRTSDEFKQYVKSVSDELDTRWHGRKRFLSIEDGADDVAKVRGGDFFVRPGASPNPYPIFGGLVHDWEGDVFISGVKAQRVVEVLEDFDHHNNLSKDVVRCRLIKREGHHVTGEWRVARKTGVINVVLDITEDATYSEIAPGKWTGRSTSLSVSEVENAGSRDEKVYPPGTGSGYLWQLDAYWSIEEVPGGVLAECRTLSLSRDIPQPLVWIIRPFIEHQPRESLSETLRGTREAAQSGGGR